MALEAWQSGESRSRESKVARIGLVKPEKARGVILRVAQLRQIVEKVSEERLI
ncbi:unnamed protein product [Eruca vesicaria subsp. sativa]|uniref:Uncharacterized protein n=1 Tax=Eruca vesicaria subsp. sativa TaxID=29727 RepID=A0ABC8JMT4_ERUVS|nr:unnamed protein product [Eruca vesicaria subsp. sativa]